MFKVIFFVLLWGISFPVTAEGAEQYEITRQKYAQEPQGDRFKLPPSLCTSSWKQKCVDMGGTNTATNCLCRCTEQSKNVFGYFGNSWKCTSNNDMRNIHAGCLADTYFMGEREEQSTLFRVVQPEVSAIGTLIKYCELESQIQYLDCNGKWINFNQISTLGFSLDANDRLSHLGKAKLDQYSPQIYGRIIKLNMKCNARPVGEKTSGHCVLLKVKGQQNCPVVMPTTSAPTTTTTSTTTTQTPTTTTSPTTSSTTTTTPSTTSSTTTTASTTSSTTTTTASTTSSTTTTTPSTTPSTTTTTPSTTSSTTSTSSTASLSTRVTGGEQTTATTAAAESLSTTSSEKSTMTSHSISPRPVTKATTESTTSDSIINSPQVNGGKNVDPDDSNNGAFIGGVAGGGVVLFIIVVLLLMIAISKRKKRPKEKRESVTPIAENALYESTVPIEGQLQSPDTEYSYAYNKPVVVITDQNGTARSPSVADIHDRNIKALSGSPPIDDVFSTPDNEPSYYNLPGHTSPDNEPSYYNLPGPTSNEQQIYDPIDSQDPHVYGTIDGLDPHVYGTIDGPDPRLYGTIDGPDVRLSDDLYNYPRERNSGIYDNAGGIIFDDRETFQEFNQAGQELRHPRDSHMAMKDMPYATRAVV